MPEVLRRGPSGKRPLGSSSLNGADALYGLQRGVVTMQVGQITGPSSTCSRKQMDRRPSYSLPGSPLFGGGMSTSNTNMSARQLVVPVRTGVPSARTGV